MTDFSPGNPWLVVLRLTVKDLVRLTVGDEDSLPHLSVQSRQDLNVPSTLNEKAVGSDSLSGCLYWRCLVKAFLLSFVSMLLLCSPTCGSRYVLFLRSKLPSFHSVNKSGFSHCRHSLAWCGSLLPLHSHRGGSPVAGNQTGQFLRADSSVTSLQSLQLWLWCSGVSLPYLRPPGSCWQVLSLGWRGWRLRRLPGGTRMSGPAISSFSGLLGPSVCPCTEMSSRRPRLNTGNSGGGVRKEG